MRGAVVLIFGLLLLAEMLAAPSAYLLSRVTTALAGVGQ